MLMMKELWKDIKGHDEYYQVSNLGRVLSKPRTIICKNGAVKNLKGKLRNVRMVDNEYPIVALKGESKQIKKMIHILVAEAFIPNPNGHPIVHHIDHDKHNFHADNLEWTTHSKNNLYAVEAGARKVKVCRDKDYPEIKRLYSTGKYSQKTLGEMYGVAGAHISRIVNNNYHGEYKIVLPEPPTPREPTEDELIENWLPIVGWDGLYKDTHMVSSHGRVKSLERITLRKNGSPLTIKEKILKTSDDGSGYPKIEIQVDNKRVSIKIHRLVALMFIPNPENKTDVNHIDHNPSNPCVWNLEWTTHLENIQAARAYGKFSNRGRS